MTSPLLLRILLVLLVPLLLPAAIADEKQKPIPLAGCPVPDMCGNMSIPFPFGMKTGCFLEGFKVTCNDTVKPPRAFLSRGMIEHDMGGPQDMPGAHTMAVELMNISAANSEAWAYGAVRSDCVTKDGGSRELKLQGTWMEGPFVLSPRRNVLVGIGRNVLPKLLNRASAITGSMTGYMLACLANSVYGSGENGSCLGQGCCQTSLVAAIPPGVSITRFSVAFGDAMPYALVGPVPPCSYGMVVASSWYNFSTEDIYGYEGLPKKHQSGVPFVLDFAIGNGSCPGQHCSGNSTCANAPGGNGYTCQPRSLWVCTD